jgi:hypothetical protein
MPFRRIIPGMSKLSADYISESFIFLMNISAKSKQNFETFRRIIRGKSQLYVDYTAERHAFPQHNPCKNFPRIILQKVSEYRGCTIKGRIVRG